MFASLHTKANKYTAYIYLKKKLKQELKPKELSANLQLESS